MINNQCFYIIHFPGRDKKTGRYSGKKGKKPVHTAAATQDTSHIRVLSNFLLSLSLLLRFINATYNANIFCNKYTFSSLFLFSFSSRVFLLIKMLILLDSRNNDLLLLLHFYLYFFPFFCNFLTGCIENSVEKQECIIWSNWKLFKIERN